ncbi:MAG: BcepIL02 gp57 [Alphaproteobacteria bacterium]|jgi:hypothetical protein|nr:BcepIL02 gp57 [Alphaproteobacteria bacterium]
MPQTFSKQPADQLDYDIDFEQWLSEGDTITSATAVTGTGEFDLIVESVSVSASKAVVKVWLSGGADGKTYTITVVTSTAGGRIKETEFKLRVKDL